ncbi:PKD domain-containing protein [Methanocalculus taiwanensis]|uniref:PKD domain-containing protein n=2 Tax=Methanocalculus taiwanensis TaxID=106207 RepID=A0ABD4TM87_9EURY|nr:PKD domain-containing protein [Methanocalculus taiwanensis]
MRGTGDCRIGYYTGVHNSPQSEGTINGSISFLLDAAEVVHQSVFPASYAEINGTEVRWNFPEITEIKPGTTLSTSAATSTFIPRESGVTIERRTNRTQFSDAGVQDAVFNITFDTIHPDGLWGRIEAANTSDVSASFIPGTVQTDLPLFGLNEGLHRIEYRINTTMIEAGNQYFISAAVAVEPTQPVMFAPSIGVWETINFTRTAAPEGTMVTVPHILLPDNVSNVSFSSATPCTWEMARNEHIISSITQRSDLVVPSPPSAAFTATPTSGAAGFTVRFNDTSTGEPTSWFWDLGDGTNSTDQHPVHTYTTPGTYSVRLTASNAVGSDTVTEQALIIVHIRGDFNGNGRVDIGDVAKVAWMAIGLMEPDPAANFKGDGEVDSADAARIAYYYVGKIPAL